MKRRTPTQAARTLRMLRLAGSRGITQLDADRPVDGPPIRRLASRVHDLVREGHQIEKRGRRHNMAVYVLVAERPTSSPKAAIAQPAPEELFTPLARRPASPYEFEDAA